jgi:hypothetical protein
MGGYGSYRLAGLYPDLFGKAFTVVGPPGKRMWIPPNPPSDGIQTLTNLWLENTRNVPFLNYAMVQDELVPFVGRRRRTPATPPSGARLRAARLPPPLPELPAASTTRWRRWATVPDRAGVPRRRRVDRDPGPRDLRLRAVQRRRPALGLVHDHAYWVSEVRLADTSRGPAAKGVIDVRSRGFGVGDPASFPTHGAGRRGLPYVETGAPGRRRPPSRSPHGRDTLSNLRTRQCSSTAPPTRRRRADPRGRADRDTSSCWPAPRPGACVPPATASRSTSACRLDLTLPGHGGRGQLRAEAAARPTGRAGRLQQRERAARALASTGGPHAAGVCCSAPPVGSYARRRRPRSVDTAP